MLIKDLPNNLKPREKLINYGVEKLELDDLLSIIIKTGTSNKSVKDLALEILKEINLFQYDLITIEKLMKIKGIGRVKAIEIIASIELGRRIILNSSCSTRKYKNAEEIYINMRYLFFNKKQEYFYCLYFNSKNELIERKLLFMGTLNRSVVHPREVFKEAYLHSASGIICMHNHPSNDLTPSKEDIFFTRNLVDIGRINGIHIMDHIIVSNDNYLSFLENGIIDF